MRKLKKKRSLNEKIKEKEKKHTEEEPKILENTKIHFQ